jgi:hypothetical protein
MVRIYTEVLRNCEKDCSGFRRDSDGAYCWIANDRGGDYARIYDDEWDESGMFPKWCPLPEPVKEPL